MITDLKIYVVQINNLLHYLPLSTSSENPQLSPPHSRQWTKEPNTLSQQAAPNLPVRGTTISPKELRSERPQMALFGILIIPAFSGKFKKVEAESKDFLVKIRVTWVTGWNFISCDLCKTKTPGKLNLASYLYISTSTRQIAMNCWSNKL